MKNSREIRQLLWELLRANVPVQCFEAVVKAVEDDTCTLEPANGDPEIFEARLTAAVDDKDSYFIVEPAIGSTVLALVLNADPRSVLVVAVQEVREVRLKIGEMKFRADSDGFAFNDSPNGGMVKIEPLIERLNVLEERMTSHQHLSATPGNPTANDPATNPPLDATIRSDLENEEVQH